MDIKGKARLLRAEGKTFPEIQALLKRKIPKGTLSYWLRNVITPPEFKEKRMERNREHLHRARQLAVVTYQKRHVIRVEEIWKKNKGLIDRLDKDLLKIVLAMLYLGEGSKWASYRGLRLGSSSPEIMRMYVHLLQRCYGIDPIDVKCHICYRADQNLQALKEYWSRVLDIPLDNFGNSKPDPRTRGKKTLRPEYMGVCVVWCPGSENQLELETIATMILSKLEGP